MVSEVPWRQAQKILIADRAWIVRDSLARLLTEIAEDCRVIMAPTGLAFHQALRTHPDLTSVYVEDNLVADEEEALFAHIRKLAPRAVIAVIVATAERERAMKAIFYGALGVIGLNESREDVLACLKLLLVGEVAMPKAAGLAKDQLNFSGSSSRLVAEVGVNGSRRRLTVREKEVVNLIGLGKAVALIAEELKLSPHTVRVHIARIMKKLDLRDRSALMHHAMTRRHSDPPVEGRGEPIGT